MSRTAESVLLEADYTMAILEDVRALNDLVAEATRPLPDASVAAIDLLLGADRTDTLEKVTVAVRESQGALARMDEPIVRLIRLLEGRQKAIRAEFDEELPQ